MARTDSFELAALDHEGRGLRTAFSWNGDRYVQTILAVADGKSWPLLESDSAPWQEIVPHELPNSRPALLLTGAGDGRYWSATVEAITDVRFALLGFELACRRGRDASLPAIAYRAPMSVTVSERKGSVILAAGDGCEFQFYPAAMPTSIATEFVDTCRLVRTRQRISVEALGAAHVSTRKTVQWKFEIAAIRPR